VRRDDLRSPIKHHLVLHRRDPARGMARFYSLMIERDLFGRVVLVRNWGRIGTNGRELVEEFTDEIEAALSDPNEVAALQAATASYA
jgi:predicted DNA-binding WGR domain protein